MASMRRQSRERYYDECGAQCPPAKATSKRTEKSKIYYGFNVFPGSRRPIPLAATKPESAAMLARIMAGTETPKNKTIAGHLANWAAALAIAGITRARQKVVVATVKLILDVAGAPQSNTIRAEQVRSVFTKWDAEKRRWSAQTKAHYLKSLNQLL